MSVEQDRAFCDIRCQVTRGRPAEWANTELARWICNQLEGRDKQWLIAEFESLGLSRDAAEGRVNRWTYRGNPERPEQLAAGSLADLEAVFGSGPIGHRKSLEAEVLRLVRDVERLADRVSVLERRAPPGSEPGAAEL